MTCARAGLVDKVRLAVCSVRFKAPEAAEEEKEKATEFCRQISRSLKGETIAGALIVWWKRLGMYDVVVLLH